MTTKRLIQIIPKPKENTLFTVKSISSWLNHSKEDKLQFLVYLFVKRFFFQLCNSIVLVVLFYVTI